MLAGFKNFDPAVEQKLACHPNLPDYACGHGLREGATPQQQATGDLVIIAFYYLLRVGEYTTKTRRKRKKKRTVQFRVKDVTFFLRDESGMLKSLPANASEEDIMRADAATLRISNQKNGHAGACVHHEALEGAGDRCPIRALGRRVCHIRRHTRNSNTFLCSYWDDIGHADVSDNNIKFAVKFAARMLGYPERGLPLDRIDTHSLRSGGACALKMAGFKRLGHPKDGAMEAQLDSLDGVHPATAVELYRRNVCGNAQCPHVHEHGGECAAGGSPPTNGRLSGRRPGDGARAQKVLLYRVFVCMTLNLLLWLPGIATPTHLTRRHVTSGQP